MQTETTISGAGTVPIMRPWAEGRDPSCSTQDIPHAAPLSLFPAAMKTSAILWPSLRTHQRRRDSLFQCMQHCQNQEALHTAARLRQVRGAQASPLT